MSAASEWRMCGQKRRYKNAAHAYRSADRAARIHARTRERLRAYQCDVCHRWHLTKVQGGK